MKRNRKIRPELACTDYAEQRAAATIEFKLLGTFYSDSWGVSSSSQFIKCEVYDALYSLQNLTIYYLMDKQADGYCVMDGTERSYYMDASFSVFFDVENIFILAKEGATIVLDR